MGKVRLNDLCRELEVKSRQALDFLRQQGHTSFTHSSSVDEFLAQRLRSQFSEPRSRSTVCEQKTERDRLIEQHIITPKDAISATISSPVSMSAPAVSHKSKKPAKYAHCDECSQRILKNELPQHVAAHKRAKLSKPRKLSPSTLTSRSALKIKLVPFYGSGSAVPKTARKLRKEEICTECRLLVHPDAMEQHKKDLHSHPKLPEIKTARFSFVMLPPGHDWDYRTVFGHYQSKSRAHSFTHGIVDWTRIERLTNELKPTLRSFGVRAWFGYAVYEFPYTKRVVVECPIEGNATYILWDDWQNRVQLTKGELRHKYPGQFRRVFHVGNWINEVRKALKDK